MVQCNVRSKRNKWLVIILKERFAKQSENTTPCFATGKKEAENSSSHLAEH